MSFQEDPIDLMGPGAFSMRQSTQEAEKLGATLNTVRSRGGALLKTLNDIAGPIALASGAALGFALNMAKSLRNTELIDRALANLEKREFFRGQFRALLGGLGAAELKIRQIDQFAKRSKVFTFEDAVQGTRNLQVLTGGLLTTKAGMELVGDAAADARTDFTTMGNAVGVLYANLRDGKPVEAAAGNLADLGVISRSTAQQVTSLAGSGAALSTTWGMVQNDLSQSAGAMKEVSNEITSLKSRLEDAQKRQSTTIGESFADGEKAGLESQIKTTEALTPAIGNAAKVWGMFYTAAVKAKAAVVEFAVSLPGLKGGLVAAAAGAAFLTAGLAVLGLVTTTQMVILGTRALFVWAGAAATASGATAILARTVLALGASVRFLLGPWGLLITVLSVAAGALADWYIEAGNASKANEDLRKHIQDTTRAMREQIDAVQTMSDRAEAVRKAYRNLVDAQMALKAAQEEREAASKNWNPLDDAPAQEKVETAAKGVAQAQQDYDDARAIGVETLASDQDRLNLARERLDIERQIRDEAEQTAINNLSGQAKVSALRERADSKREALATAESEEQNQRKDEVAVEQMRDVYASADEQVKASEQYFKDKGITPKLAESTGRRGVGGEFGKYVKALDNRKQSQELIDAYAQNAAESRVFKAQNMVDQVNRPGSTATGAEKQAAQLELDRARKETDPNRARVESATADAALRQGQSDYYNQQSRDLQEGSSLQTAGKLEKLRGSGLKGEELKRAEEGVKIGDARRRARLAADQEEAIKARQHATTDEEKQAADEKIARLGATGMTVDQARNNRKGAENEISGIRSDRALRREQAERSVRYSDAEMRADRRERGGGTESAERMRDAVRLEERILQLRSEGLKEEEATKQARKEQRSARADRMAARRNNSAGGDALTAEDWYDPSARLKKENEQTARQAMDSIRVDSLASIGGNAGAGGGTQDLLRSILDELKRANRTDVSPPQSIPWDDKRERVQTQY